LANLGFAIGAGSTVSTACSRARPATRSLMTAGTALKVEPDVVLIGCVKTKQHRGAPAKDLYVSD